MLEDSLQSNVSEKSSKHSLVATTCSTVAFDSISPAPEPDYTSRIIKETMTLVASDAIIEILEL